MVQIWDHKQDSELATIAPIAGHGKVGYVVKQTGDFVGAKAKTWRIICFGDNEGIFHNVHETWLRPINKSSDIKKIKG